MQYFLFFRQQFFYKYKYIFFSNKNDYKLMYNFEIILRNITSLPEDKFLEVHIEVALDSYKV